MSDKEENTIDMIRSASRNNIQNLRIKNKENILGLKRIGLLDASEFLENISLSEFKELLLTLKRKSVPIEALKKIKNSCIKLEYIEAVFKTVGAITSLIRVLTGNDTLRQLEAAACLVNLACGPHKCSNRIGKAAGAYFVSFLCGSSHLMQDLSAWAIGNIANDCCECYKLVKAQGSLPALLAALESSSSNVLQSALYALNACTKYEDPETIYIVQLGLLKNLYHVLQLENTNQSAFLDAAFILSNCCYLSVKYSGDTFGAEAVETIFTILRRILNGNYNILFAIPLIRCLGFLSYKDDLCVQISKQPTFCSIVQTITQTDCLPLKKELIWVLSNITVSRTESSPDLFLPLIIDSLGPFLRMHNTATLQVLYYLLCAISKDSTHVSYIEKHDIFPHIECLLTSQNNSVRHVAKEFFDKMQCL